MKKIYVGNLAFGSSEESLRSLFEKHGAVDQVTIVRDRETGQPRGFAFVEMADAAQGEAAIAALHQSQLDGRTLNVSEARPKPERGGESRSPGRGGPRR